MVNRLIGKRDKKEHRGFRYKARSTDAIKKRATQTGGRYDTPFINGIETYRVNQGDNAFRILPPTWDEFDHYGYDIFVHSYVGSNSSTYLCLKKMKNKPCPICEAEEEAAAAGDKEAAKELRCTQRVAVWVIDRQKESEGPKIYSMPWSQDRDIAALCMPKKGKGNPLYIDHPDQGFDVLIQRSGQKLNTRYFGLAIDRESTPISDNPRQQDKWLAYIEEHPIPEILKFYDEDYLRQAIEGTAEAKDKDLDEEDEGDGKSRKRTARRRGDEEEDEDNKSSRRRASNRREEEDPEDEEAEDYDESEDDPEGEQEPEEEESGEEEDDQEEEEREEVRHRAKVDRREPARREPARRGRNVDPEDDNEEEEVEEPPRSSRRAPRQEVVEEEEEAPPHRATRRSREVEEEPPRRQRLNRDRGREEEEPPRRSRRDR